MPTRLLLRVLENDLHVFELALDGPLELGRQRKEPKDPPPYALASFPGVRRLVIASDGEMNCSRHHVHLEPKPGGTVSVRNGSQIPLPLLAPHAGTIPAGGSLDLPPPFKLSLPPRTLVVSDADSVDEHGVQGLDQQTLGPGNLAELSRRLRPPPRLSQPQIDELVGWMQTTMGVLQSTVGSADFLDRAAAALVQIVGLQTGHVLLLEGDRWTVAASSPGATSPDWKPSQHVLDRARNEKRTFYRYPRLPGPSDSPSLAALQKVVAAPLLNRENQVIGALYGEGQRDSFSLATDGKLEAMLVELLACGVSTGRAREEQERAAFQAQVQFELFFGAELAQQLRQQPHLLEPKEIPVTVLFCDIRGFSGISEKQGPVGTLRWIGDVLSELSHCVLRQGGVLVDYVGDELLAMFGAPCDQPDQAMRGARAGLAMLEALAVLNGRWQATLGGPMDLGIGINTGPAVVGNSGSCFKFKYGPLGNTVNVGSRVQGLTKYLKCRLLVTEATRRQLEGDLVARRVCRTLVKGIQEPVNLFEVDLASTGRGELFRQSEEALGLFETKQFAQAARCAGELLQEHHEDGPLQLVLSRAAEMLMRGGAGFDPIWQPPGK